MTCGCTYDCPGDICMCPPTCHNCHHTRMRPMLPAGWDWCPLCREAFSPKAGHICATSLTFALADAEQRGRALDLAEAVALLEARVNELRDPSITPASVPDACYAADVLERAIRTLRDGEGKA